MRGEGIAVNRPGFTLVEIMIVIAIVVVLATVGVPSILRSRVSANEAGAIASLKVINNACQSYSIENDVYPESLAVLSDANPPYLDSILGSGRKQGYDFVYVLVSDDHFTVNANSIHTGMLRGRYFYIDETSIVRSNSSEEAGPDDNIVG